MLLEEAIAARLLAASAVTDLVDDEIDWSVRRQGAPLRGIVLQMVSGNRPQHLDGFEDMRTSVLQADCYAELWSVAAAMADAAGNALTGEDTRDDIVFWQGSPTAPRSKGEQPESGDFIHCASIEIVLRWGRAA